MIPEEVLMAVRADTEVIPIMKPWIGEEEAAAARPEARTEVKGQPL